MADAVGEALYDDQGQIAERIEGETARGTGTDAEEVETSIRMNGTGPNVHLDHPDPYPRRGDSRAERPNLREYGEASVQQVTSRSRGEVLVKIARRLVSDLAEFSKPPRSTTDASQTSLPPEDDLLAEYDRRINDVDLRAASRSRFVSKHYADAVESGVKALNECVRSRTGRSEDGDALMTAAFSPNAPLLRINRGRSKTDESEQRGHMYLCQGVIGVGGTPARTHLSTTRPPAH